MPANSDTAEIPTAKPVAKISLVEAACARFESAQPVTEASQPDTASPLKQRAHERLRLLQGSGLGAASHRESEPAQVETAAPAAQAAAPSPVSSLRIHAAWAALCLALAAALVLQLNQNAASAPAKPAAAPVMAAVQVDAAPAAPNPSLNEPLALRLQDSLFSRPVPRP
ncbi:MAG: hypothetical protein RL341_637 [Pseudomonadota bacterium]|jgi:hypothetical protein